MSTRKRYSSHVGSRVRCSQGNAAERRSRRREETTLLVNKLNARPVSDTSCLPLVRASPPRSGKFHGKLFVYYCNSLIAVLCSFKTLGGILIIFREELLTLRAQKANIKARRKVFQTANNPHSNVKRDCEL